MGCVRPGQVWAVLDLGRFRPGQVWAVLDPGRSGLC